MKDFYYTSSDGELCHWSFGSSAGKGKERENHKYVSREWKNGRWNYIYPEDLKAKKASNSTVTNKFGKQAVNTSYKTQVSKPSIANKPKASKAEIAVDRLKRAVLDSTNLDEKVTNYWNTKKKEAESSKRAADTLKTATYRSANNYVNAKENLQDAKHKGLDKFDSAKKEYDQAKKTHENTWNLYKTAEKAYERNPVTIAGNVSKRVKDVVDTAKDISEYTISNIKKAADSGRDYIKDILGFDERERYEKAQNDYSNASRKDALANQAGIGDRNASSKRVDDAAKNLRDAKEAFENTPLSKLTEASKAVKSGMDYCKNAIGSLIDKADHAVRLAKAKKDRVDEEKAERASMEQFIADKKERAKRIAAQNKLPSVEEKNARNAAKKAVDDKIANVEKMKAQRKLNSLMDDINDLTELRDDLQKDMNVASKKIEMAIQNGDKSAEAKAVSEYKKLKQQFNKTSADVAKTESEFDEMSDEYNASYDDYADILEEERKKLGIGVR